MAAGKKLGVREAQELARLKLDVAVWPIRTGSGAAVTTIPIVGIDLESDPVARVFVTTTSDGRGRTACAPVQSRPRYTLERSTNATFGSKHHRLADVGAFA